MRILTFILLLIGIHLGAYTADNPTKIIGKTTRWELYTTSNSKLPNNIVTALFVDVQHMLWIGTKNGVVIAKDTLQKVLHVADGLSDEKITCIYVDGTSWAWIGSSTNGVTKYKQGSPTVIYNTSTAPPGKMSDNSITGIAQFSSTNYWFSTVNGGLNQLQGTTVTSINSSTSGLTTNYTTCIQVDSKSHRWFGTMGMGLWDNYFDKSFFIYDVAGTNGSKLPNNLVRCLYIDALDRKFIGTDGGLAIFDGPNWTIHEKSDSGLPSNRIYCVMLDLADNIWAGTDSGLACFDGIRWYRYNVANTKGGIPSNIVNSIAQDDSMYLWVGTNMGLSKLKQRSFSVCPKNILCGGESTYYKIIKTSALTSTYQWQVNIGGGWSNVSDLGIYSGSLTNRLSLTAVGAEFDSTLFRCIVKFSSLGNDTSNVDTLFVHPTPSKPTVNILSGQLFTDPAPAYQWYYYSGSILIPGATTQGHIPGLTTDYYVEVSNSYNCKTKSDPVFAEGNALKNEVVNLAIYPNPSSGRFTISGNAGSGEVNSVLVVNNLGNIIYSKKNPNWKGLFTDEIVLNNVSDGVYYLKINSSAGSSTIKLNIVK
jgi:hypothetical protein